MMIAAAADPVEQCQTGKLRQLPIEDDQVEMFFGSPPQGQLACGHMIDGIPGVTQRAGQAISQRLVVFNQ